MTFDLNFNPPSLFLSGKMARKRGSFSISPFLFDAR